jgi:dynein heavy chain 1
LHAILGQTIYGGNVDVVYDQRLIATLLTRLFSADALAEDCILVDERDATTTQHAAESHLVLRFPRCSDHAEYLAWSQALAEQVPPTWLGLPRNADTLLLSNETTQIRQKLKTLNYTVHSPVRAHSTTTASTNIESATNGIGAHVIGWCKEWLALLPEMTEKATSTHTTTTTRTIEKKNNGNNPIFQYLASQYDIASSILRHVRQDMELLRTASTTNKKLMSLVSCIEKGTLYFYLFNFIYLFYYFYYLFNFFL